MAQLLQKENIERFFIFMAKREALRLRKESGAAWPWSDDLILNKYKFTNVKREHDRTTKWMRRYWTDPNRSRPEGEVIFNCALFRYFGTVEFGKAIGWQKVWNSDHVVSTAIQRQAMGQRVFTGAYIVPTLGIRRPKAEVVCRVILQGLWSVRNQIAEVAVSSQSWRMTAERLMTLPGFGGTGFMAKEVLQDVMQTPVLAEAVDRNSWCPAGPGARRGLNRIAGRPTTRNITSEVALGEMIQLFGYSTSMLPSFMPSLELHDIQFQLCEFDKYERVRLGEGAPKQRYRATK